MHTANKDFGALYILYFPSPSNLTKIEQPEVSFDNLFRLKRKTIANTLICLVEIGSVFSPSVVAFMPLEQANELGEELLVW